MIIHWVIHRSTLKLSAKLWSQLTILNVNRLYSSTMYVFTNKPNDTPIYRTFQADNSYPRLIKIKVVAPVENVARLSSREFRFNPHQEPFRKYVRSRIWKSNIRNFTGWEGELCRNPPRRRMLRNGRYRMARVIIYPIAYDLLSK